MEQKNKLFFTIIIATFMFSSWNAFNISLDESYKLRKKLDLRTYRLLAKYIENRDSNNVFLKEKTPYNEKYEKKDPFDNDQLSRRNIYQIKSISNNAKVYGPAKKYKFSVCKRRDSYIGKRILDHIYYKNNVRYATNNDIKFLKRCKKNKIYLLYALYILYVPLLMVNIASINFEKWPIEYIYPAGWELPVIILSYILPTLFLLTVIYICSKIEKYDKLLYIKSKMNNRKYYPYPKIGF
ncbi:hypothetical protein MKS88_002578 [Plasmodium brasilianum]|uniref:Fam-m protein n=2 Tax=Plasmodium (Plasmodium) TaxID=418103 RepID=A0A1D3PAZ8_PLAMA|nr:Plasmodium exported protein, unknown function [Plasmodium malariae]KAI4839062.1 hypothetical protein MKS88_002578 [Plasmodium brasilianum]SCN12421.1 Plasmodium exported protein, unknown function [Plasmodium malariae]